LAGKRRNAQLKRGLLSKKSFLINPGGKKKERRLSEPEKKINQGRKRTMTAIIHSAKRKTNALIDQCGMEGEKEERILTVSCSRG